MSVPSEKQLVNCWLEEHGRYYSLDKLVRWLFDYEFWGGDNRQSVLMKGLMF